MKYDLHSDESETFCLYGHNFSRNTKCNSKHESIKIFEFDLLSTYNAKTTSITFLYLPFLFYQVWRNLHSQVVCLPFCLRI